MENASKFLRHAFYFLIFFLAVTLLYVMSGKFDMISKNTAGSISRSTAMMEAYLDKTVHYVKKAELIALLMGE